MMQQLSPTLYIGDQQDALSNSFNSKIDIIIYLGQQIPPKLCFNCIPTCIHMPLIDGENSLPTIKTIILTAHLALVNDNKVLIACRAGKSRSVAIATAVYALLSKIDFDSAYYHVLSIRTQGMPEQKLLQEVKQITEELKCCL